MSMSACYISNLYSYLIHYVVIVFVIVWKKMSIKKGPLGEISIFHTRNCERFYSFIIAQEV